MALTLAEAVKLSNDVVLQGVIETVIKQSRVLEVLPFIGVSGNALTYNRENAQSTVAFYAVGDAWVEGVGTRTQVQSTLKILGGDADVDAYLEKTRSNIQDLEAVVLAEKSKVLGQTFEDRFIYGSTSIDANAFDGLHALMPSAQMVHQGSGSTPAALSLANLDIAIDLVKPGKPDFLLMSRRTRRGISAYSRALTSPVEYATQELGVRAMFYDGIPIFDSDYMVDTETISGGAYALQTTGASSSIIACKVGEGLLAGLDNGGIQVQDIGPLETKDARRHRIKWYVSLALFSTLAVSQLDGISSAAVVA